MSWPLWLCELAREFAIASTAEDWPGRRAHAQRVVDAIAKHELAPRRERPASVPANAAPVTGRIDKSALAFPPPSGGSPKAARRAERAAGSIGRLRAAVMARARRWFGNVCEFCRAGEPETMHHVLKGSERVAFEDEASCAAVCDDCDKKTEASPAWARTRGLLWARRMADEARRRSLPDLAAGFDRTAELLEGKIALADAKALPHRKDGTT